MKKTLLLVVIDLSWIFWELILKEWSVKINSSAGTYFHHFSILAQTSVILISPMKSGCCMPTCGKEARKEMKIFLEKILYPVPGNLCSVDLEVLVPKRRMLLPENTTMILLNWIKTAVHLLPHSPFEFTGKQRSYCIGWGEWSCLWRGSWAATTL